MFNTIRPTSAPSCLSHGSYNKPEVLEVLEPMFHGKCYMCEQDELADPEVEHLDPHEKDAQKKYDWNNLYYACGRCNGIKSTSHKDILDCCDSSIDMFRSIRCLMPSTLNGRVSVDTNGISGNPKSDNTVRLIDRCYNEDNTGIRAITRVVLLEKLFANYTHFLQQRLVLKNKKSTISEKQEAKDRIERMLNIKFPFSVFWRWHILEDDFLRNELSGSITF